MHKNIGITTLLFLISMYSLACAAAGISEDSARASRMWFEKGKFLSRSGNHQDAIKAYGKAIELNPLYYKAHNNRGNVYFEKQKYDKAIEDYTRAIKLNPRHHKAYTNRGIATGSPDGTTELLKITPKLSRWFQSITPLTINAGLRIITQNITTKPLRTIPGLSS